MAYGSAKGRIFRGDIYAEDDPNQDTYIDWGNDFISFGVGGVKVLNVSASNTLVQVLGHVSASGNFTGSNFHAHGIISASSNITASGHVSASAFYGDGQYLKNVGGGGTPGGANTNIQFNNGGAFLGTNNFKWEDAAQILTVSGSLSSSAAVSSSEAYVGYLKTGTPGSWNTTLSASSLSSSNGNFTLSPNGQIILDGAQSSGIGEINLRNRGVSYGYFRSSSYNNKVALDIYPEGIKGVTIFSVAAGLGNEHQSLILDPTGSTNGGVQKGLVIVSGSLTASHNISASAFYGDGQYLQNVGGGGGIFTTLGSGNAYTTSSIRVGSIGEPSASIYVSDTNTSSSLTVDKNHFDVAATTLTGLEIDFDKSGSSTSNNTMYGLKVDMDNTTATDGANFMYGIHATPTLAHAADAGVPIVYGMFIGAQGDLNGTSLAQAARFEAGGADINYGIVIDCEDGTDNVDLRIESSADNGDYFQIQTTTHGATTIKTYDDDATAAHLTFNVDGDINLTPVGNISASSNITASGHVSASAFYGDGQYLKNIGSSPGGGNTMVQYNDSGVFDGREAFTYNKTSLTVTMITASAKSAKLTGSAYGLAVSSSAPAGGGGYVFGGITFGSGTIVPGAGFDGARIEHVSFGGDKVFNMAANYGTIVLTASEGITIGPPDLAPESLRVLGPLSGSSHITASGHVSASAFYGDGQYLKNVGGAGTVSTTTGGGNNTLFLPFVSSSTGVGSATLFTDGALGLKPQSGSLTLSGDGKTGVSGSFLGEFTTTSSYGSRVALKGANVGSVAGTEPYIHPVSSSYTVPAGFFGGGQPPSDVRINYETLEIVAPSGLSRGGDVSISGSGNLHISFTNPTGSGGWPFTPTWQSTMEFGSLETAVYLTSSVAGDMITSPWSIINGADSDGAMYGGIDYESGGWFFSSGSNPKVEKFSSDLTGSWSNNFNFNSPGSASFFGGLIVHNVPLTSNVGAQIGGGSGNKLQVVVTSSFENIALFGRTAIFNNEAYFNNKITSNNNELMISGSGGGGMAVNITSSNNDNSLYTGGSALLGHSGGGNADIRLFAGGSGQAGTISGSSNLQLGGSAQVKGNVIAEGNLNTTGGNISGSGALMIAGNADIAGNTTLGTGNDSLTLKVNSVKSNASDFTWLLRSGSVGTGSGPGKNGPLMFYITHSGGSTTDLLKFNTASGSVGVVFPTTFYPNQGNSVDIGSGQLAFRTLYTHQAAVGTTSPQTALDVHYTGSFSPTQLSNGSGGGEVVYFGTGSLTNVGGVHYLNSKGGWVPTNADATGSGLTGDGGHKQLLGIALGSSPSANGMLIKGFFNATGGVGYYMGDFQTGSAVYLQAQGAPGQGRMSGTAPTGSGRFVRVVGYATDTPHVIYFNPDSTYVEIS